MSPGFWSNISFSIGITIGIMLVVNNINNRINTIEKDIIVIKTALIVKEIIPKELLLKEI